MSCCFPGGASTGNVTAHICLVSFCVNVRTRLSMSGKVGVLRIARLSDTACLQKTGLIDYLLSLEQVLTHFLSMIAFKHFC